MKKLEIIGEVMQGHWSVRKHQAACKRILRRGKKLSRHQFVRRTAEDARKYAEFCARTLHTKFAVKDCNYREGEIDGKPVLVMGHRSRAWLFRESKVPDIWKPIVLDHSESGKAFSAVGEHMESTQTA